MAIYVADGRDMALPLLADGLTHDWNWILSGLSLRNQAVAIGRAVFVLGVTVLVAAIGLLAADLLRSLNPSSTSVLSSDPPGNRKMQ